MKWNAELYDITHNYVSEYGKGLLEYVPCDRKQVILDLGCGTGTLTNELAKKSGWVIGADGSEDMIRQARNTYPAIDFQVADACKLLWKDYFDVIFSNAVFHWIKNQDALLNSVHNALKENGLLVCEFGARGNIAAIQAAVQNIAKEYEHPYISPFYFPGTDEYSELLKTHGFQVESIFDFDRPTPLNHGADGLKIWMKQFFAEYLLQFTDAIQSRILEKAEAVLKPKLWDGEKWVADYRRIRAVAYKV